LNSPCYLFAKPGVSAVCIAPHQYLSGAAFSPPVCICRPLRPNDMPTACTVGRAIRPFQSRASWRTPCVPWPWRASSPATVPTSPCPRLTAHRVAGGDGWQNNRLRHSSFMRRIVAATDESSCRTSGLFGVHSRARPRHLGSLSRPGTTAAPFITTDAEPVRLHRCK
jgi:hypothetical protein